MDRKKMWAMVIGAAALVCLGLVGLAGCESTADRAKDDARELAAQVSELRVRLDQQAAELKALQALVGEASKWAQGQVAAMMEVLKHAKAARLFLGSSPVNVAGAMTEVNAIEKTAEAQHPEAGLPREMIEALQKANEAAAKADAAAALAVGAEKKAGETVKSVGDLAQENASKTDWVLVWVRLGASVVTGVGVFLWLWLATPVKLPLSIAGGAGSAIGMALAFPYIQKAVDTIFKIGLWALIGAIVLAAGLFIFEWVKTKSFWGAVKETQADVEDVASGKKSVGDALDEVTAAGK